MEYLVFIIGTVIVLSISIYQFKKQRKNVKQFEDWPNPQNISEETIRAYEKRRMEWEKEQGVNKKEQMS